MRVVTVTLESCSEEKMLAVGSTAMSLWVREWFQSGPAGAGHSYEDATGSGGGGGVEVTMKMVGRDGIFPFR